MKKARSTARPFIRARLRQALALIDIRVLDHILVAANMAISLAEHGKL